MWFTQVALYICGLLFRRNKDRTIGLSAIQTAIILALGAVLIMQLYFNSKFEFKTATKISIGSLYVICLMMIPRYITLRDGGSIWWAPVVLEIIVAHYLLAVQMGVEYFTWNEKKTKWLKERRTFEEFQATDASERDLRSKFNTITIENENDFSIKKEVENYELPQKTLKVSANYYSSVFFGLMKVNKPKFKLLEENQADLFYRACFIYAI